eukprot:m.105046 g.105046  ORF g.105046 m.105046 type:complete len:461 (-) comp27616_c0_seq1:53-1435(-)
MSKHVVESEAVVAIVASTTSVCGGKCPCPTCTCGENCTCGSKIEVRCDACSEFALAKTHATVPVQGLGTYTTTNDKTLDHQQTSFAIGTRIQARVDDDRLYYSAVVTVEPSEGIMQVKFDDDREGVYTPVPLEWAKIGEKTELYRILAEDQPPALDQPADDVIVSQGWLWTGDLNSTENNLTTGARRANLLSFGSSPKVYQSGAIVTDDGGFDWTHIFDPEQALALSLALVRPSIKEAESPHTVVLIGGGGCTMPMAISQLFGSAIKIEVVELHEAVMQAAHRSFGLPRTSPDITPICGDGLAYLNDLAKESRSIILLDVCSTTTEDGAPLEFPSEVFLEDEFLLNGVLRPLRMGGVFAMNVIANAVNLERIALKLKKIFGNVHVLATDPGVFFFSKKGPSDEVSHSELFALAESAGLIAIAADVLEYAVLRTDTYRDEKTMVGWLGCAEFLNRINNERK